MPKIGILRSKIFLFNFGESLSLTEFGPPERIIPFILLFFETTVFNLLKG